MSTGGDDRDDTLLDRLNNIVEEGEEEEESIEDDDSIDPDTIFDGDGEEEDDESLDDEDEEDDYDGDTATPLEYHWAPNAPDELSDNVSFLSDFQSSGFSLDDMIPQDSAIYDGTSVGTLSEGANSSEEYRFQSKRGSFSGPRRFSNTRCSFSSTQSAPQAGESSSPVPPAAQRRVTISVPSQDEDDEDDGTPLPLRTARQQTRRRQSINLKSINLKSMAVPPAEDEESASSNFRSLLSRKSTRRTSGISGTAKTQAGVFSSMDSAISTLGQGGNSEWENVAAAAAVVAAGSAGNGKRSHTQFAVDEKVLVFLNILNHTNSVDDHDAFTVNPVNRFGYPRGEGKTHEEQQGPYVHVLATVKKVHFDEDLRYYTVARADSGAEQRADTAWMEQIKSPIAVDAATRAANQTSRSEFEKESSEKEDKISTIAAILSWPVVFANDTLIPLGRSANAKAKEHIELILYGSDPYSCNFRATGINLLVCCSAIYLFLEVIALAFIPARFDIAVAAIGATVWSILALELILERIIRPPDYSELIQSEKAYAPSTARSINSFHLFFEVVALILFIPGFVCLRNNSCGQLVTFSGLWASVKAVLGPTKWDSVLGRFCIGLRSLRMFGLVRHWKIMRLNNTFSEGTNRSNIFDIIMRDHYDGDRTARFARQKKNKVDDEANAEDLHEQTQPNNKTSSEEDQRLKKAATIGTSLMVINSHRALVLLSVIVIVLPMINSIMGVNRVAEKMTDLLQQNNIMAMSCEHLELSVDSWLKSAIVLSPSPMGINKVYVLWAQISPSSRCDFLNETQGVITNINTGCNETDYGNDYGICECNGTDYDNDYGICEVWDLPVNPENATPRYFANELDLREGAIANERRNDTSIGGFSNASTEEEFTVRVLYNQNHAVSMANIASFLLLLTSLVLCLFGLAVLRGDAARLVLHPLRRMLKIVVRYAENPLSQTAGRKKYNRKSSKDAQNGDDDSDGDRDKDSGKEQLGNYETEQLINAISKIADLLRKCWGVAGAGIISSNLARTQDGKTVVFNPTVPGKQVYALFGFVTINGFSDQLRALDRDVMILINDVAGVVHDEVFRWALGDSGQCNKNLGSSFLMVFRIGDFKEVHEKQARATDVVFSSTEKARKSSNLRRRKKAVEQAVQHGRGGSARLKVTERDRARGGDTLQLASLPGIQTFSDRALLGMLKSFAGILRDKEMSKWKRDFRLGAGVGAYVVNIIIGMDAGWAVEGAVGSEYKIDATYLSPHVNMAARMMSATKQYGVTILLSQAVEELLSAPARSKLRHLDTVCVKGSSVAQRIFTYDARHRGVDFFLFERSPEQSDLDAEAYTPLIWENDQDLRAMRQHVTEEFSRKFKEGKDLYLSGEWKDAIQALKDADDIMITNVLEEGYIDYNPDEIDGRVFDRRNTTEEITRIRGELGDGTCKCLIAYMEKRNGTPPDDWKGVRELTSK